MILYLAVAGISIVIAYLIESLQQKEQKNTLLIGGQQSHHTAGAYFARHEAMNTSLVLLFLVLWIPEALRQATGNDYMRYVEFFHLANVDAYVPTEIGFNLLVKLVYRLCGYENYLLVFALFAAGTILFFLLAIWKLADHFGASFALFMAFGFYFQSYNTVRYYFALSIVVFALAYLLKREYVTFLCLVLFAAAFHKSALVVLVLYPLALHRWKKWQGAIAGILFALLYLGQNFWMQIIVRLYPSYADTEILAAGGSISWYNVIRCIAVLALFVLAGNKEENRAYRFYRNATVLCLAIYVFGSFIPELSRICYYLVITQIFAIPAAIDKMASKRKLQKIVIAGAALAAVLMFAAFLYKAYDPTIRILPYKTFLFHELPGTPSRSIE